MNFPRDLAFFGPSLLLFLISQILVFLSAFEHFRSRLHDDSQNAEQLETQSAKHATQKKLPVRAFGHLIHVAECIMTSMLITLPFVVAQL